MESYYKARLTELEAHLREVEAIADKYREAYLTLANLSKVMRAMSAEDERRNGRPA